MIWQNRFTQEGNNADPGSDRRGSRSAVFALLAGRPFLRKMIYRLPESLKPSPDQYGFVLGPDGEGRVVRNLQDSSGDFCRD